MIQQVLTGKGFVPISQIKEGDRVYDKHGKPTKVKSIMSKVKQTYQVTVKPDVTVYLHDEQELFILKSSWKWQKNNVGFRTLKFKDFKDSIQNKAKWNRYYSPVPDAICLPSKKHFVHPYIIGSLLGDGGLTDNSVIFTTSDMESIDLIEELLPCGHHFSQKGESISYNIVYPPTRGENHVKTELYDLNMMGKSALQKNIPKKYLYGSTKQRLQLLQGLMDTDGTINAMGRTKTFSSSSKQLAENVMFLCRSLGGTPSIGSKVPFYRNNDGEKIVCNKNYVVYVKLPNDIVPFKLKRKVDRIANRFDNNKSGKYYTPYQIFEESLNIGDHLFVELEVESDSYIGNDFFVFKSL